MDFLIQNAWAQGAGGQEPSLVGFLPLIILFVVFYLFLIRPQMKRQKDHSKMVDALAKGDEAVTTGGLLGRITEVGSNFVKLEIAKGEGGDELLCSCRDHGSGGRTARVVEQDVHGPVVIHVLVRPVAHLLPVGEVGHDVAVRLAVLGGELRLDLLQPGLVARHERHPRTEPRDLERAGAPDPLRAAADERMFAFE